MQEIHLLPNIVTVARITDSFVATYTFIQESFTLGTYSRLTMGNTAAKEASSSPYTVSYTGHSMDYPRVAPSPGGNSTTTACIVV